MNAFTKNIVLLIDQNNLSQLKMVLNKASSTNQKHKVDWGAVMQHCALHDHIDAMDMVEARAAALSLNGKKEPYLWRVALCFAQSANMAHHILDQLEPFVSEFQPLSIHVKWVIEKMGVEGGHDAIKAVVERCNLQNDPHNVSDDGFRGAVKSKRLDVVDLFLPLVSDTVRTQMLTYASRENHQPLIDHLYTLERAQATLARCAEEPDRSKTHNYPGLVYLHNKVSSELTKHAIESHIDLRGATDPDPSFKKPKM